jgi:hypothetical protein
MGDPVGELISGAIIMAYLVAGLYFLRFWKESADRLFMIFGIAFWVLGGQRILLFALAGNDQAHPFIYGVRLLAFLLILGAILDKNRTPSPSG